MGTEGAAREPAKRSTPDQYSVALPPGLQAADHSWVLQTVMELQKSVGGLTQAVTTLTEQVKDQGAKLDAEGAKLDAVRREVTEARTFMKAAAKTAAVLLGGVVALIAWFASHLPPVVTAILETIRASQE